MESIHPEGTLALRITIPRMERRPVVPHSRNLAAGCTCLSYGRGSSVEGAQTEL